MTFYFSRRYSLETEENGSRLVIRGTVRGDGGEFSCQVMIMRRRRRVKMMMLMICTIERNVAQ